MIFSRYFIPIILTLLTSSPLFVDADPNMEELEGTWSSKSNTVFTGPGFYDPVEELLIEPDLPGFVIHLLKMVIMKKHYIELNQILKIIL